MIIMRQLRTITLFILLLTAFCGAGQAPETSILMLKAPASFRVLFTTTKGNFVMEATRKWSPRGVDRLYQLVTSGYFNNSIVFRVEPGYVAQFGIAENYSVKKFWYERYIQDEPVLQKHTKGMVAFARDEKNSRSTQLFINLADNPALDTTMRNGVRGFSPIAKVISGMDVVEKFYGKYGRVPGTQQIDLYRKGNAYYEKIFPGLDKIINAKLIR